MRRDGVGRVLHGGVGHAGRSEVVKSSRKAAFGGLGAARGEDGRRRQWSGWTVGCVGEAQPGWSAVGTGASGADGHVHRQPPVHALPDFGLWRRPRIGPQAGIPRSSRASNAYLLSPLYDECASAAGKGPGDSRLRYPVGRYGVG